jgi:hypothetical protein
MARRYLAAAQAVATQESMPPLARTTAKGRFAVRWRRLPPPLVVMFDLEFRLILCDDLAPRLRASSSVTLAPTLARPPLTLHPRAGTSRSVMASAKA